LTAVASKENKYRTQGGDMIKRTQRDDRFIQKEELLATLYDCRRRIIGIETRATIGGPLYVRCAAVREAIDGGVEVVTGDRTHFWEKGSTAR
jgi:hypothetical protein